MENIAFAWRLTFHVNLYFRTVPRGTKVHFLGRWVGVTNCSSDYQEGQH